MSTKQRTTGRVQAVQQLRRSAASGKHKDRRTKRLRSRGDSRRAAIRAAS
ncbi:hypothetical protein [Streptomyces nanshensis]|nr:hypothetical protein [Streptomyces nanshensis]